MRDGKVEYHFAYWVPEAIERSLGNWESEPPENWRELLAELAQETLGEVELLTGYAEKIGQVLGDYWSVDFAQHEDGTWYLIDMGEGDRSFDPRKDL